jgi:hypothetical protein
MLNTNLANLSYLPFPHAVIEQFFDPELFLRLRASFPDYESAQVKNHLGAKSSLSPLNNPDNYYKYLKQNKEWKWFYDEIKKGAFIHAVVNQLKSQNIDLRCGHHIKGLGFRSDIVNVLKQAKQGNLPKWISSRFEFSMMPADGGCILPHTDHPNKILTMVVGFNEDNELDDIEGAECKLCEAVDPSKSYNNVNNYMRFDEINVLKKVPITPNRALLFIKTHNSLHCVGPMKGPTGALRKTITINLDLNK